MDINHKGDGEKETRERSGRVIVGAEMSDQQVEVKKG